MVIRIANVIEDVIPNLGAAVLIITKKKVLQLGLEIDPLNTLNLTTYENPLGVVEIIKEAPLQIKGTKIPLISKWWM